MNQEQADQKKQQIVLGHANIKGMVTSFRSLAWVGGVILVAFGLYQHEVFGWVFGLVVLVIAGIAQLVTPKLLGWLDRNQEKEIAKVKVDEQ